LDNIAENERAKSKQEIIRILARHTDVEQVKGKESYQILRKIKENPNTKVVFNVR